ncbi:MAG TPA: TetR/AcrR family transcriptional regulator [Aquamicrobium sp.]|jgi:AcrR family transcriptional regulator|nr:TetR/AcrR family transcriptional regulator [Aquamicrobium sp.]
MGRSRKLDREALLDAAQEVVSRDGASNLTIEAVAANAGVGKATVLYDYKSKHALVRAMLERRIEAEDERLSQIRAALDDGSDAAIHAWIRAALRPLSRQDRTIGIGLMAELASDPELNRLSRGFIGRNIADAVETATEPAGARLAFLAVEGLKLLDHLGLHTWSRAQIEAIIDDIGWLAEQKPEPARAIAAAAGRN